MIEKIGDLICQFEAAVAARTRNHQIDKAHVFDTDHFNARQALLAAYESVKPKEAMEAGLPAYAQGVTLLSLAREIGGGTRSYPEAYERGHTLVGLGIAEYADTLVKGTPYWLRLTDAGCAMLSAAGDGR